MMIRTAPTLATALLFVVSGCASNAGSPTALPLTSSVQGAAQAPAATVQSNPSPSVNHQAPNALDRLALGAETHLTLRFKNITQDSILHMGAFVFECASVEPKKIDLLDGETARVVITANTNKLCQDRDRFVYLDMYFRSDKKSFDGFLKVHADPPKYVWTARLSPSAHKLGLCTDPDGFEHGRLVHDDELIEFYLCG